MIPTMSRYPSADQGKSPAIPSRRTFLKTGTGLLIALPRIEAVSRAAQQAPTQFQIACMTLPYSQFSFQRALSGLQSAGYKYVAWGTSHREGDGKPVPIIPPDAPPARAKELAARCRDLGLEPLMMFSGIYPEAPEALEVLTRRIQQAEAGGVPQVLTFGHTRGSERQVWVERFKKLGPIARQSGVMIVVKQHGGNTGTGEACAEIVREVADDGVKGRNQRRRPLDIFLYTLGYAEPAYSYQTHWDAVQGLQEAGLRINPRTARCTNIEEVIAYCQALEEHRHALEYDADGVVVKVDSFRWQAALGRQPIIRAGPSPLKFAAQQAVSRCRRSTLAWGAPVR